MKLFKVAFPYSYYGTVKAIYIYADDEAEVMAHEEVKWELEENEYRDEVGFVVVTEVPMEKGVVAFEIETNI